VLGRYYQAGTLVHRLVSVLGSKNQPDWYDLRQHGRDLLEIIPASSIPGLYQSQYQDIYLSHTSQDPNTRTRQVRKFKNKTQYQYQTHYEILRNNPKPPVTSWYIQKWIDTCPTPVETHLYFYLVVKKCICSPSSKAYLS
jgi:hypothetical protein